MDDDLKLYKVEVRATVWVLVKDQENAREAAKGIAMDYLNEDQIALEVVASPALANQEHKRSEAINFDDGMAHYD